MAKAYTRNIFYRFQREMRESLSYECQHVIGYQFELSIIGGPVPHYGYRNYKVFADWDEGIYSCNCCKFERDGVLCCHVIKVMTQIRVHQIPDRYILKRWTWDAEAALGDAKCNDNAGTREMPEETRNMMVFASMRDDFRKVATVACRTNDGKRIVRTHLKAMKQELDVITKREEKKAIEAEEAAITMPSSSNPNEHVPQTTSEKSTKRQRTECKKTFIPTTSTSGSRMSSNTHVQNPTMSSTKGRPQEIANKAPLDLATKKVKRCSFCNSADHTIRKCQEKLKLMGYKP